MQLKTGFNWIPQDAGTGTNTASWKEVLWHGWMPGRIAGSTCLCPALRWPTARLSHQSLARAFAEKDLMSSHDSGRQRHAGNVRRWGRSGHRDLITPRPLFHSTLRLAARRRCNAAFSIKLILEGQGAAVVIRRRSTYPLTDRRHSSILPPFADERGHFAESFSHRQHGHSCASALGTLNAALVP